MRETGPKGCSLVTVGDDHSVTSQFEPLDAVRWEQLRVESDDSGLEGAVRNALQQAVADADGRLLAVRLEIVGSVSGGQRLRDRMDAVAVEVGDVWLEKVWVAPSATKAGASGKVALPLPLASEIRELIASIQADSGAVSQWMAEFAELRGRLWVTSGLGIR